MLRLEQKVCTLRTINRKLENCVDVGRRNTHTLINPAYTHVDRRDLTHPAYCQTTLKDPEMSNNISKNENDPYKEVIRGGLKLKKGKSKLKKKKKESVDLKSIDITIHKDADATVTYKTPAEIAFEKRQLQNQFERLAKKAAISHREKVEKFNQQMSELTEFNDIPKVSWTNSVELVAEGNENGPSTSNVVKDKLVPSYTYNSWKRLRDVCRALQETQAVAIFQREKLDRLLESEEENRQLAEQAQCQQVELRALRDYVERQKCRVMTCRMKLIHFNDEKFQKDITTSKRSHEVIKMQEELLKRKTALSLAKDNLHLIASHLAWRRRKMVGDLMRIYVINLNATPEARLLPSTCTCHSVACITGLHLPDSSSTLGHSDVEVSAAIGYVVQILSLLSRIYNFPYQYSMYFFGSKSTIKDPVLDETYPLYGISRNREKFEEGMSLLNRNISQLRWSFGITTRKLGKTLPNLQDLLLHIVDERIDASQNLVFRRPSVNCGTIENLNISSYKFAKQNTELNQGIKSSKVDAPFLCRQTSIGSNKSTLLLDSSAIAALTLISPQNDENNGPKKITSTR
uniref:UV radiation resistance-associated gene protein n=1 Tax=Setaria digitata TaxID=48799 RepID=A0A915PLU1_9BILA